MFLKDFWKCFGWLTCCQTKNNRLIHSFNRLFVWNPNRISFVSWISFNWFHNRIRSCFKCFDQDLNTINSLLMFYNKQQERKTYFSFSRSFQAFEFSLWALVIQERSEIGLFCIDFSWFYNSVIRYVICEHSSVVKPRRVVCSWGCQDQHSWCVCWAKGSVFLEGIKVTSLVVCVCNLDLIT